MLPVAYYIDEDGESGVGETRTLDLAIMSRTL